MGGLKKFKRQAMKSKMSKATLDYLARQSRIQAEADAQLIRQALAGTLKGRRIG